MMVDIDWLRLRKDFPFFNQQDKQSIYFDNAATTQKPDVVLSAMDRWYKEGCSAVHRGVYALGEQATMEYENARAVIAQHIGAHSHEIIFTSGATSGCNFIAFSWVLYNLKKGDEIVITELEHHSNILPWQRCAQQKGIMLTYIPLLPSSGELDYDALDSCITSRTKLVAFTHCSNALGTMVAVDRIVKKARSVGARILLDASQTVPYLAIDVKTFDVDFLVFSGHKMLGPTGIGVLYAHERVHDQLHPYELGGGTVTHVDYTSYQLVASPWRYEGGTQRIAEAIGLARAVQYLRPLMVHDALADRMTYLSTYCIRLLRTLHHINLVGVPESDSCIGRHIISFYVQGVHAHDVATYLDTYGIAVRAGNHCAQIIAQRMHYLATVRVSFYLYNTTDEIDRLIAALKVIHNYL